jgi:hypothetical protein
VAERPKGPQNVNLAALVDPNIAFDFKTAEFPEEKSGHPDSGANRRRMPTSVGFP